MKFEISEKLAIVQAVDSVILADGKVHNGEINALSELMYRIDFETNFIVQARNVEPEQGIVILDGMPDIKKQALAGILEDMANADGFFHEKEMTLIRGILASIGIGRELN
ncbi:tellurite resistance TerB family protein [Kriegella aquimaris]|nr:TerB family tellurite resistance protein [Kriegella aquimaris]